MNDATDAAGHARARRFRPEPLWLRWPPWIAFARWAIWSPIFWLLFFGVIGGAVTGYIFWYGGALARAPEYLWPFVPDSPLSVTVLTVALLFLRYGRRLEFLGLVGIGAAIKYGLWTPFVWFTNYLSGGEYHLMAVTMSVTHFAFLIEAFILAPFLRFRPVPVLLATLFLIVNDVVDYVFGFHPSVPNRADLGAITVFAVGTTAVIVLWWAVMAVRARRREGYWLRRPHVVGSES